MFHLRDGFFFERLDDGSVRIRYAQPVIDEFGHPAPAAGGGYFKAIIAQVTVPENEWASVLASVCAAGETSETWQAAREYHATGGSNPAISRCEAETIGGAVGGAQCEKDVGHEGPHFAILTVSWPEPSPASSYGAVVEPPKSDSDVCHNDARSPASSPKEV